MNPNRSALRPVLSAVTVSAVPVSAHPFAAPETTGLLASSAGAHVLQTLLALAVVLALVLLCARAVAAARGRSTGPKHAIEVIARAAVGSKEQAVLIRIGAIRLLLGVAPGAVTLLQTLPVDADGDTDQPVVRAVAATSTSTSFAALLRRGLGAP